MTWDIWNVIGTIAFAVSGVIVAMEEEYDILGVYFLGLVTAFGGGATRNLLIGVPVDRLWEQGNLFMIAIITMTIVFVIPNLWFNYIKHWTFFDALGLSAFAIQGALYAVEMQHTISAAIFAALLTGSGGGLIRDVLAHRKPLIFRDEIYALWAMLGGLVIGLGWANDPWELYVLFAIIVSLRLLSVKYHWKLPKRKLHS
ncbi:trimeric intracellular cation channel family protein [Longirhabdus pacifica]|uniref:trimeric intracellular cation channel family protein n=1 Tax=Longirhabdus pacifica TaxID=2305227 RepID=UPI00100935A3|nr:trimeric intracellular cation channel family protein [Longirhabdus pacifica]